MTGTPNDPPVAGDVYVLTPEHTAVYEASTNAVGKGQLTVLLQTDPGGAAVVQPDTD